MSYQYKIDVINAKNIKGAVESVVNGKYSTAEYEVAIDGDSNVMLTLHVKSDATRILFSRIIEKLLGNCDRISVFEI